MADISKISIGEETYNIKDATARSAISMLNSFDYVLCDAASNTPAGIPINNGNGTLVASVNTIHKIYLVPVSNSEEENNVYDEYITINTNTSPYYMWEKIGNTRVNLENYLLAETAEETYATKVNPEFTGTITLGNTDLSEAQLYELLNTDYLTEDTASERFVPNDNPSFNNYISIDGTRLTAQDIAAIKSGGSGSNSFECIICTTPLDTPRGVMITINGSEVEGRLIASDETENKLYLVPYADESGYDKYITVHNETNDSYFWEPLSVNSSSSSSDTPSGTTESSLSIQICDNASNTPKDVETSDYTGTLVASEQTTNKLYFVPRKKVGNFNYYDEYVTIYCEGAGGGSDYTGDPIDILVTEDGDMLGFDGDIEGTIISYDPNASGSDSSEQAVIYEVLGTEDGKMIIFDGTTEGIDVPLEPSSDASGYGYAWEKIGCSGDGESNQTVVTDSPKWELICNGSIMLNIFDEAPNSDIDKSNIDISVDNQGKPFELTSFILQLVPSPDSFWPNPKNCNIVIPLSFEITGLGDDGDNTSTCYVHNRGTNDTVTINNKASNDNIIRNCGLSYINNNELIEIKKYMNVGYPFNREYTYTLIPHAMSYYGHIVSIKATNIYAVHADDISNSATRTDLFYNLYGLRSSVK